MPSVLSICAFARILLSLTSNAERSSIACHHGCPGSRVPDSRFDFQPDPLYSDCAFRRRGHEQLQGPRCCARFGCPRCGPRQERLCAATRTKACPHCFDAKDFVTRTAASSRAPLQTWTPLLKRRHAACTFRLKQTNLPAGSSAFTRCRGVGEYVGPVHSNQRTSTAALRARDEDGL